MAAIPIMKKNELPGYQLISAQYHQGGFGKVYFAIELSTGKTKAIKKSQAIDNEGRKYEDIIGLGIVKPQKTFYIGDYEYNVMEKWDCSYKDYLYKMQVCSEMLYETVEEQIAKALCSICHSGYTHCDVKLSNILIKFRPQFTAGLADLSLIKKHEETPNCFDTLFFCLSMWKARKRISYDFDQYHCTVRQIEAFVLRQGPCTGKYADLYWRVLTQDLAKRTIPDMPTLFLEMMKVPNPRQAEVNQWYSKKLQKARRKRYIRRAHGLKTECEYCKKKFSRKNIQRHKEKCPYSKSPCIYCEKYVLLKELDGHLQTCNEKF